MTDNFHLNRPQYGVTDLRDALAYPWRGYQLTEKLDGRWHELGIGSSLIVGELMPNGRFFAFDIPIYNGRDVRPLARSARLELLDTFPLARPQGPRPGETPAHFLARILDAGGEGMVAARLDAPWGADIFKVKREVTFDCVVLDKHPAKESLRLALLSTLNAQRSTDNGWVPCRGRQFSAVRPGDVVEVAAWGLTARGKLREPRFIRPRPDKSGAGF